MPMMPHMPMVGAGAGGGSHGKGQGERNRIELYPDRETFLLRGGDTISEAVPGGTIAQNKPSRAA
ncbi:Uncharacterised protein [Mycobacteroides abscessus subsp. abscessus]|nr:Uncharacterised protein [Mycobacteroides abscessus subsp. abscessus]